jgi:putative ubiquitin-RnfH superfamily antitoxin RatB of RatAB toxin-antitoxin module
MAETSTRDGIGAASINVEIVYADPDRQILRKVEIAANSTVAEALDASGVAADLPAGFVPAGIGIFGRPVTRAVHLHDGDRIELYRPLQADPKESRRKRAAR